MRSDLKLRAEVEGGFIQNLASGRHHVKGGARETRRRRGGSGKCRCPDTTASADEQRDRNAYAFESIAPPGVGTIVYRGVTSRGTESGTERGAGINWGYI